MDWGILGLVQSPNHLEDIQRHFGSHSSRTEAARALVGMRQIDGETIAFLKGRMSLLTKVAYVDTDKRNDPATQVQLAEFFTDALSNPL